jgi:O-antigen ligase
MSGRLAPDLKKLERAADCLVMALAVSLPWSTSATAILAVIWVLVLLPTLRWADISCEISTLAGGLPVLLFLLGLAGMAWSDVTLIEKWRGLDSFVKLLAIPLLFAQFSRSDKGAGVFAGYLCSCVVLLVASYVILAIPPLAERFVHRDGAIVKNAATQSGEFVTCVFGLLYLAMGARKPPTWPLVLGILLVVLAMLASILYVATGRTALIILLVLLVVLASRKLSNARIMLVLAGVIVIGGVAWSSSTYLRGRTTQIWSDLQKFSASDTVTSSGERLVFWTKSIGFIRQSPLTGHGTGSIRSQFEKSAVGQTGAAGEVTPNPHNQTFAVAIQLGLVGAVVLWAMWVSQLLLFRGSSLAGWVGLVVVVQNIVGSFFNSHIFDFVQGWTYVVGIGVAGGMVLGQRRREIRSQPATDHN